MEWRYSPTAMINMEEVGLPTTTAAWSALFGVMELVTRLGRVWLHLTRVSLSALCFGSAHDFVTDLSGHVFNSLDDSVLERLS